MFFRYISEIKSIIPTSKWDKLDILLGLLEEEEDNNLRPILGDPLFDRLASDYGELVRISEFWYGSDGDKDKIRILRTCQKVALYMVLSRNSGLLSVSFNAGGGINAMNADGYDTPNNDLVKRFERDAWGKANRSIDTLLRLLERDAQQIEPLYRDLWMHSRYFYFQGNMLFTTATEFQRYLNIEESRARFISLIPEILYAQSVYIQPRIGQPLLDYLIAFKYNDRQSRADLRVEFVVTYNNGTSEIIDGLEPNLKLETSNHFILTDSKGLIIAAPALVTNHDFPLPPNVAKIRINLYDKTDQSLYDTEEIRVIEYDDAEGQRTAEPAFYTPGEAEKKIVRSFADKVMSACALYVEAGNKDLRRDDSRARADMQIALACRIVQENAELFWKLIGRPEADRLGTVLYGIPMELPATLLAGVPGVSAPPSHSSAGLTKGSAECSRKHHPHKPDPSDPRDHRNAVFAPFGSGLRRH